MKNIGTTIFLIAFTVCKLLAQNNISGIYLNWQDYKEGKLSFTINCDSSSGKIKTNCIFSQNHITIIRNGEKTKLNKDSIFGYRDCKQNDFRFKTNDDREYQILENKNIIIYVAYVGVPAPSGKGNELIKKYLFSTSLASEILPLTVINLKRSTKGNLKFHDSLDVEFPDGNGISNFDSGHNMYKVNFLLSQSINQ